MVGTGLYGSDSERRAGLRCGGVSLLFFCMKGNVNSVIEQTGRGDTLTNGGTNAISTQQPYRVAVTIRGDSDILFHRWNCEAVEAKGRAAKGSKAKKSDDVESYVYRDEKNNICLPGEYLRQSVIHAAKYQQDPRSPRKSAMDLVKAGVVSLTPLAPMNGGVTKWDYDHAARVQVQRNGITRIRPALRQGWTCTVLLMVNLPEYLAVEFVQKLLVDAGRLIGVADFRPSYGRFSVTKFDVLD